MFYGQNCSGRFGENKSIISVAGSKEDVNFVRLLNELQLRKIKRELNEKYFLKAVNLAEKYSVKVSIAIVQNNVYGAWKSTLYQHPNWFGKLYGIVCKKALEQIKDKTMSLHMDREYDSKTLGFAADVICKLLSMARDDVYIRNEKEHPTNRIMVADLFARGQFKGYNCSQFNIIKNPDIKNELKEIFGKTR